MKIILKNLFLSYALFLAVFVVFRAFFFIYYIDRVAELDSFWDVAKSFYYALSLDFAMAAIYLIIPWFLLLIYSVFRYSTILQLLKVVVFLSVFTHLWIFIAELGTYGEWEAKPTYEILEYLKHPEEALNTVPILSGIILALVWVGVATYLFKVIFSLIEIPTKLDSRNWIGIILFAFVTPVLIIIVGRGGLNDIPITSSEVYFSKSQFVNDATVNSSHHFIVSVLENRSLLSGEKIFTLKEADKAPELLKPSLNRMCESPSILTTEKPNIVIIILESWSADLIEASGGYNDITPEFNKLVKDGFYFSNTYGVGMLSHVGLPGILSGFPKVPNVHITDSPKKYYQIPKLAKSIKQELGYQTLFLFGGQLRYGNIKGYIYNSDYDEILEEEDFSSDLPHGSLGVHDEYAYEFFTEKLDVQSVPFFATQFTVSSHSPYDHPMEWKIERGGEERPYLNSANYADKALGDFFNEAKKKPWFDNTLFVLVADHSHITPTHWNRSEAKRYKIPFLLYGNVLKESYKGRVFDKTISQLDIATTLLKQINVNSDDYLWSRDVLCKEYVPSAYMSTFRGFGMVNDEGSLTYNIKNNKVEIDYFSKDVKSQKEKEKLLLVGKNYLDQILKYFLSL